MTDAHAALAEYDRRGLSIGRLSCADDLAAALRETLAALAERDADDLLRSMEGRTDWDYEQRIKRFAAALDDANARIEATLDHAHKATLTNDTDDPDYDFMLAGRSDMAYEVIRLLSTSAADDKENQA